MTEYIDRQELYGIEKLLDTDVVRKSKTASWLMDQFLHDIKESPAADVVPVVHGKWILKHIGAGHYWECSVCHKNPCIYVTNDTKFCPNCGAKMDGR